ncbi:MAG: type II toxin-antitoxin system HicB family antitoxin [candidate division KSB1 bacterium]|nr:type II toxin-antitoxin system HicB family antitoxin [candidate division KSB1 bacterium]
MSENTNKFKMNKIYKNDIQIIIEKGDDGYFVVHCPTIKACWSQGKTQNEALKNIQEAIDLYLSEEQSKSQKLKFRKFDLGEEVHVDRDELYSGRG